MNHHYLTTDSLESEVVRGPRLSNVLAFVQLIFGPHWPTNQLCRNPKLGLFTTSALNAKHEERFEDIHSAATTLVLFGNFILELQ